jgi:hypothetical protein
MTIYLEWWKARTILFFLHSNSSKSKNKEYKNKFIKLKKWNRTSTKEIPMLRYPRALKKNLTIPKFKIKLFEFKSRKMKTTKWLTLKVSKKARLNNQVKTNACCQSKNWSLIKRIRVSSSKLLVSSSRTRKHFLTAWSRNKRSMKKKFRSRQNQSLFRNLKLFPLWKIWISIYRMNINA